LCAGVAANAVPKGGRHRRLLAIGVRGRSVISSRLSSGAYTAHNPLKEPTMSQLNQPANALRALPLAHALAAQARHPDTPHWATALRDALQTLRATQSLAPVLRLVERYHARVAATPYSAPLSPAVARDAAVHLLRMHPVEGGWAFSD
jgi:hypothetical protein